MPKHQLKPGSLIVLEGLDKTGKTTQSVALQHLLDPSSTAHVHMPSGLNSFTDEMYSMLESARRAPTNGLAKQLAHLACHAESVPRIRDVLRTQAVVLDRWWWSTLAYGWYSGDLPSAGVTEPAIRNVIDSIWSPLPAAVVFLFDKPYRTDVNNSDPIRDGYHGLASTHQDITVQLPQAEPAHVTAMILEALRARDLLVS